MIDEKKYEETDHPELIEFEGKTLGDTLTNLLAEVLRLRKIVKTEHNLKLWEEAEDMEDFKRLRELLDAIHWDAFAEDDTTLEIDREVAERIRIVVKLEDARIESASMYDRPKLFDAVREIYEQRLQDIYQEKREEE